MAHSKELETWRRHGQGMATRFNAVQNGEGTPSEKAEKLNKLERNFRYFREGLVSSPLTPEDQEEIEALLPPL